jgi:AcrR family transcriptional regulator
MGFGDIVKTMARDARPARTPANRGPLRTARRRMSIPERKHEIVLAAARLFDVHGFGPVTVDEIAGEVGVSKAAIYYYFSSKQEILEEVFRHVEQYVHENFDRRSDATDDPLALLRGVIFDLLEMHNQLPSHQRVYVHSVADLSPDVLAEVVASKEDYRRKVGDALLIARARGLVAFEETRITVQQILGMGSYSYQWWDPDRDDPQTVADQFWANIYGGLSSSSR